MAPIEVTDELVEDLASVARLAPSCANKQPWRFVFASDPAVLERLFESLTPGNAWVRKASLVVAVLSKREMDCVIGSRLYYLFDVGMATAFLILRATELGLIAHPIAGFDPERAKEALGVPEDWELVTLVNVGAKAAEINPNLSEPMKLGEIQRPPRLPLEKIYSKDGFDERLARQPANE